MKTDDPLWLRIQAVRDGRMYMTGCEYPMPPWVRVDTATEVPVFMSDEGDVLPVATFENREAYRTLNKLEGFVHLLGWGGSDLIGGSERNTGSSLTWQEVVDAIA